MFRMAVAEDCKAIYDIICDMEAKDLPYDEFSAVFSEQLSRKERYSLILCCSEADGETIGAINLRFENQLHHADLVAEIMELGVVASHRNCGLGKQLFDEACRIATERGCCQIEVACNQLRKDTHRFYLRRGMQNFHFKFSKSLKGEDFSENVLGR